MNRIAIAMTALVAASTIAGPAFGADAAAIAPHVWSTRITGTSPAVLNGTWRLAMAAVSDRCAGRKTILTRPFTRVL